MILEKLQSRVEQIFKIFSNDAHTCEFLNVKEINNHIVCTTIGYNNGLWIR